MKSHVTTPLVPFLAFISLIGCTKVERNRIVPESLPYTLTQIDESKHPDDARTVIGTSFDSATGSDAILWLEEVNPCRYNQKVRAFLFGGRGSISAEDQRTLNLATFPGLGQVQVSFPPIDLNGNGTRDYLFSFAYGDSVVVRAEDTALPPPYLEIFRTTIRTPKGNQLSIAFPLWYEPTTGDTIIPFISTNKQQGAGVVYDSLYLYSVSRRRIIALTPVGATLASPRVGGGVRTAAVGDSLLVLESFDDNWQLPPLNGLDHDHRHLAAFRPDGAIAWLDTLDLGSGRKKLQIRSLFLAGGRRIVTASTPSNNRDTNGTLLQLFDTRNGREAARQRFSERIYTLRRHTTPGRSEEIIAVAQNGIAFRLDSLLHPIDTAEIPVTLDYIDIDVVGPPEFDLDGDDESDFLLRSASHQTLVISGGDLTPLCALDPSNATTGMGAVRIGGRAARVITAGDQIRCFAVEPTPLLARIAAHREKLLWLLWLLAILALPLAFYATRRILYLRSLFGSLTSRSENSAVATFDGHGRASSVNDAALEIFGLRDRAKEYGGDDFPEEIAAMIERTLTGRETLRRDVVIGAGEQRYLAVVTAPLRRLGSRSGCLLIATEATELVEAELRRNALLLARAKAHDAKQPLGTIELQFDAMMTMLRKAYGEMPRGVEDLERRIGDELNDAADRVRAIMHMADVAEFIPVTADLSDAVERWLQKNRGRYERNAITFTLQAALPLDEIALDEGHLSILLQCACDNASEAMADRVERSVTLRLRSNHTATTLEIIDTGIGMDSAMLERVRTQPYYTNRTNGTGFGMRIIRKVCEAHHAALAIDSTLMGGTTVRIAFPRAIARSASSPESAPSGNRTALQVDRS